MKNPVISIIVPCYNIEQHLPKCIDSLLAQTFRDFELLLIDDGSADGTLSVCNAYKDKDSRIKVFTHANNGVSFTRNRGITLATGVCIMFIDGDDYVKTTYVEKLFARYSEGVWPICGMINVKNGQEKKNENFSQLLLRFPHLTVNTEEAIALFKHYVVGTPCANIYSSSIIKANKIYFDREVTYQEDLLFNLQYLTHINTIELVDYFGYYYIEHASSSSNRYHKNFDHLPALYNSLITLVQGPDDEPVINEFILQSALRKIANVFHPNSSQNKLEKRNELKRMFESDYFNQALSVIDKISINPVLKFILKTRNSKLLYRYFQLLHKS